MSGMVRCAHFGDHPALAFSEFDSTLTPTCLLAGFKTHISTSTMVGAAYGWWGVSDQGMSIESSLLAAGLCSVSGMLPDLDSDSGVPLRETSMFVAAIAPMLMIDRFRDMGLTHEAMALAAMLIYVAIRFVAVEFFKRYTVHRGMWHSIPAALVAGLMAYMVMPCPSEAIRVYKSLAVFVGFMTHLILDEIWSLDFSRGRLRVKSSFGTALKFFGNNWWANVSVWAKLALLIYFAHGDHEILDRLRHRVRLDREQYAIPEPGPMTVFPASPPAWADAPASPPSWTRSPDSFYRHQQPPASSGNGFAPGSGVEPANRFDSAGRPWQANPGVRMPPPGYQSRPADVPAGEVANPNFGYPALPRNARR